MKKNTLILSVILFISSEVFSQNGFQSYNMPSGIWSSGTRYKNDIKIDANDNVWIAFRDTGLGKFDGVNWTVYTQANSGLPSNRVTSVDFDSNGNVWAGTWAGLVKFDGVNWVVYNTSNSGLPNDTVHVIGINANNIWAGTKRGASVYDGTSWNVYDTSNSGIIGNVIYSFAFSASGETWIGTTTGLSKFYNNSWVDFILMDNGSTHNWIQKIIIDANQVWVFAAGGTGNPLFKITGGVIQNYFSDLYAGSFQPESYYNNSLAKNQQGKIFFMGRILNFSGIMRLNESMYDFFYAPFSSLGSGDFIDFDSSGKLWFASAFANVSSAPSLFSFDFSQYVTPLNIITDKNSKTLEINNVKALMLNRGDMHWDLLNSRYEVPKDSGKTSVFASALWIGGLDQTGQLHMAAQTYRQTGNDFWPGPIDTVSGIADSASVEPYDRIWKVDRFKVEEFKYHYQLGNVQNGIYPVPKDIAEWPAQGTGNISRTLAPFVDYNTDGIYNPYDGDYPLIKGDQMLYWIFNDNLSIHTETGGLPLGFEIHASAYAYTCPLINDSNSVLNTTTLYNYRIINRSNNNYDSLFIGFWCDVDLGDATDDYVGCDTTLNAGFAYNGDNDDAGSTGYGYGLNPPMQNIQVLKGPEPVLNDGIDNDHDGVIDEIGERCMMNHFLYYNGINNVPNGAPSDAQGFYYYLQSIWLDSLHMTYSCNGRDQAYPLIDFMYCGTPYDTGLTEINCANPPEDRRFIMSSGPFSLAAGGETTIDFAYVFTWDSTAPNGLVTSIARNTADLQRIKYWFDTDSFPSCLLLNVEVNEVQEENNFISIYPNPANEFLVISSEFEINEIKIFDLTGREVQQPVTNNLKPETIVNIKQLPAGLYILQVKAGEKVYWKKFVRKKNTE